MPAQSPKRAINTAPGTAAIANIIGGKLDSQPISVSDRCRSACNSGTTGGTAKTVSRRQAPESQSSESAIARWRADGRVLSTVAKASAPNHAGEIGAGEGIRTLDPNLGKVVLYP